MVTSELDRDREVERVVNIIAAALPGVYLLSGSLAVTALAAVAMIVGVARRRTEKSPADDCTLTPLCAPLEQSTKGGNAGGRRR
jgi:hypothetical protein